MRRALVPLLAFCLGLVGLTGAAVFAFLPDKAPVGVPGVGGPFTLVNQDGRTVTERDFAGATHLVFFGFTHCPDVCPTTLQQISAVLAALGPKGQAMRVAFITVDPERDDPASLKTYLSSFDPRITGLTGTPSRSPPPRRRTGLMPARCRPRTATTRWSIPPWCTSWTRRTTSSAPST